MTRRCRSLNMLAPEALLEMHPDDAAKLGIRDGELATVTSRRGRIEIRVMVTGKVAPGVVFSTFHISETPINRLTNDALDPVAKIPELKVSSVRVEKL